ncbi:MAG TPA: DUF4199 domain-containing protein [Ferruginibacter sp.]|nr:DUF4199 domain-containing protein [Ferruginibacter sp.]HRO17189.1 DUF4199 domain-containing protein [Ferruginibacter sp.]HRQ19776.1 DUF4199 domain-containing protein [Ferruginibacter sp.]
MINLSPTLKGLITGVLMIVMSVYIYSTYGNFENNAQYITYALYIGGLIWTLVSYHQQEVLKTFKTYFSQGFKYFIVVTMLMVLFTIVFMNMNPSIKEEMAQNYRNELFREGNKTPAEIENLVLQMKEYYSTMITSMAIFFYLLVGTILTVIFSILLIILNKKRARH